MKSTAALKAACLSVGLATAWSPLGIQQAHAGTVVNVHLNIGTTGHDDPGAFNDAAVGLLLANNTFEMHAIHPNSAPVGDFSSPSTQDTSFTANAALEDIKQFVVVGLAPHTHPHDDYHVIVSSPSLNSVAWSDIFIFPSNIIENDVGAQLETGDFTSFLTVILSHPSNYANVLQYVVDPYSPPDSLSSELYEFSTPADVGVVSLDLVPDVGSAAVPLPSECLMGGALFATLALGKHTFRRLRLREAGQLA